MVSTARSSCPCEEELATLLERGLRGESDVEAHVARCAACRGLLGALAEDARAETPTMPSPSSDAPCCPLPGQRVGRYVIVEVIGAGSMGMVFVAHDPELNRQVAVKLLRGDVPSAEAIEARTEWLRREAQAMARLSHPNVVTVYDVGSWNGQLFITMELVLGGTLRDWCTAAERSWREVLDVFLLAGRGLAAAHCAGLVHRDFKPENVLVDGAGQVRVTDFGLVRTLGERETSSRKVQDAALAKVDASVTRTGVLVGTPAYMAPEQLDLRGADARSDVFSFAVALWEALHGTRPFGGETIAELRRSIARGPPPLSQIAPTVPRGVEDALRRALREEPCERYESMHALVEALAAGDRAETAQAWSRKVRLVAWAGVLAAIGIAMGLMHVPAPWPRSSPAPAAAVAKPFVITDVPPPDATALEARVAYISALQALRDGAGALALEELGRAVEIDPSLAAAHLRLAAYGLSFRDPNAFPHLRRAFDLRAALSERDQAILAAFEPLMQAPADDGTETSRRLATLATARPNDAEIRYLGLDQSPDPSHRDYDGVLALDPKFALVLWHRAFDGVVAGERARPVEWLQRCIDVSGRASSCWELRALLHEESGECAALEEDARTLIRLDHSWVAPMFMARAQAAEGASDDEVKATLASEWARAPRELRDDLERSDRAALAILHGDFAAADALERGLRNLAEIHVTAAVYRALALREEMGDDTGAGHMAIELLGRVNWGGHYACALGEVLGYAVRGRIITAADRDARRSKWELLFGTSPENRREFWLLGRAIPARTAEEAREALETMPGADAHVFLYDDLRYARFGVDAIGRLFVLGGRPAEALAPLRAIASSCSALSAPLEQTHALFALGEARESLGDSRGACDAYAAVLARWGRAQPRSVTAIHARARAAAIGCDAKGH